MCYRVANNGVFFLSKVEGFLWFMCFFKHLKESSYLLMICASKWASINKALKFAKTNEYKLDGNHMIKLQFNLHITFLGLGIFIGLLNFFQLLCPRQACYHSICSKLPFFICKQMGSSNVECIWFSRRTYQGNCVAQLMGCKHAKVSQFMNFFFGVK